MSASKSAGSGKKPSVHRFEGTERLHEHWVSIVLTVISIIQGLAVAQLAVALDMAADPIRISYMVLAFVVIVRVFQTYVTAALAYDDWQVNFFDIVLIFGIGIVEYRLLRTLSTVQFSPKAFETWFAVIAVLAIVGHAKAFRRIQVHPNLAPAGRTLELNIQGANLFGAVVSLILAVTVILGWIADPLLAEVPLLQAVILSANTYWSVRMTMEGTREQDPS